MSFLKFIWQYQQDTDVSIKEYVKHLGISRKLLSKIKFQGGSIRVNGKVENVLYQLTCGDSLELVIPDERSCDSILEDPTPLDIVFEDEHLLVLNKPAGIASIPVQYHPNGTIVNRVKAYYRKNNYADQQVHVVTRLDRDTSGLMLIAKHGFAHAMLDQALRRHEIVKMYQALVGGEQQNILLHGFLCGPIARSAGSIMQRQVDPKGQPAKTEYWLAEQYATYSLLNIRLHTGRTHQIRVHFADLGCPLLGDELYGGDLRSGIERQALHCKSLTFQHPFTKAELLFTAPVPRDMHALLSKNNEQS